MSPCFICHSMTWLDCMHSFTDLIALYIFQLFVWYKTLSLLNRWSQLLLDVPIIYIVHLFTINSTEKQLQRPWERRGQKDKRKLLQSGGAGFAVWDNLVTLSVSRLGIPFRARSRSRVLRLRCLARRLRPNAALVERGLDVLIRMVFLSRTFFAVGVERAPRPNFDFSAINCVKHLNAEDLILRSDGKDFLNRSEEYFRVHPRLYWEGRDIKVGHPSLPWWRGWVFIRSSTRGQADQTYPFWGSIPQVIHKHQ